VRLISKIYDITQSIPRDKFAHAFFHFAIVIGQFHLLCVAKHNAFYYGQWFGICYEVGEIIWFAVIKKKRIYLIDTSTDICTNFIGGLMAFVVLTWSKV